jgi:hypothetical protein
MYELGIRYDHPYRKCARIVGDTMGKYHPHGDSSIYEALVVMAQDFKKGKTLVDGHGNFGSIEGDGAAAMRYTEARLEKLTQEVFLSDLDKNVVDFLLVAGQLLVSLIEQSLNIILQNVVLFDGEGVDQRQRPPLQYPGDIVTAHIEEGVGKRQVFCQSAVVDDIPGRDDSQLLSLAKLRISELILIKEGHENTADIVIFSKGVTGTAAHLRRLQGSRCKIH